MKTRFNPLQTAAASPSAALPQPKARQNAPKKKATKTKRERPPVDSAEALARAANGQSLANYPAIFEGLALKGIPADQIKPRENVFTFEAWRALGRTVRRGEHGVRVVTMVPCGKTEEVDPETGEVRANVRTRPWRSTVFHVSQTDPIETPSAPLRTKEVPVEALVSANAVRLARLPETESNIATKPEPTIVPVAFPPPAPEISVPIARAESISNVSPLPAATAPAAPAVSGWRARLLRRA